MQRPSAILAAVAGCVAGHWPATGLAETALPASWFTDSVGVNLHLEYTNTYYHTRQDTVERLLRDARIKHVRTRVQAADINLVPATGTNSNATNSVALLSRAGVRTVITGAPKVISLYLDTLERRERTTSNGWRDNFDVVWANADKAQAWWDLHAPGTTRIEAVEGVNEPNIQWGATCANWMSKTADFQHRMNVAIDALPRLRQALRVGPSLVSESPHLCGDGPSKDPFRSLGRHAAPMGAGFTMAWNSGWTAPANGTTGPAWFSATPGSVADRVDVANLHAYPSIKDTPEAMLKAAFWLPKGVNKCGGPTAPADPGPGATPASCAAHVARLEANGQAKPIFMTEAGYQVSATTVSERTRGIYLPRLLLSNFQYGIARTYIYELMQWLPNSNTTQERYWLAGPNGATAANLGYQALRRLQLALGDGNLPKGQQPTPVDLTVSELSVNGTAPDPAYPVQHLLFKEDDTDQTLSLALWPTDVVAAGPKDITPPVRKVRITLAGPAKRFTLHPINPESGTDILAGQALSNAATQVDVDLSGGHAVVVKIR